MTPRTSQPASSAARAAIALLAVTCLAPAATAAADRTIEDGYSQLLEMSEKVAAVTRDFDAIQGCVLIRSSDPAIGREAIRLVATPAGGAPVTLPLDDQGCVTLPPALAGADAATPLTINVPKGKATLGVTFTVKPPTTRELDYAGLQAGAMQLNAAIRREAGVMRFMAPKIKGVLLLWKAPDPAEPAVHIQAAAGERRLASIPASAYRRENVTLTDIPPGARVLEIELDDKLVKANPKVTLDALPDIVMPLP
ncbi:hypothetical protein [Dokdonella koreensis]|nr:hypothetical protein [Dokdonella koreensis]